MSETSEDSNLDEVTLGMVFSKISEVLEMNDLLHSEMAEIKNTLKAIVEVAKSATEEKPALPRDDTNHTMYG